MAQRSHQEQKAHSSALIPHSYYRGVMPDYYPEITRHWHQEFELFLLLEGECCFLCGSRSFMAGTGDIILVQPNEIHAVCPCQDKRAVFDILVFHPRILTGGVEDRMYIDFFAALISCQKRIHAPITALHPGYPELRASAENVFRSAREDSAYHDVLIRSELLRMFVRLLDSGAIEESPSVSPEENTVLAPVLDYIRRHFADEITIRQLAQITHFSESYFMNYFRRHMGMSAMKYVDQIRMEHVCQRLRSTKDSILQIATQCGFGNITNFNRHFLKGVGMTPSAYRAASKNTVADSGATRITRASIYDIRLKDAYTDLLRKAAHRNRMPSDVDALICWLTGYTQSQLAHQLQQDVLYCQFFHDAPQIHPDVGKIRGTIHGMRIEAIQEPLMRHICQLDKLVDELARGRTVREILQL